MAGYAEIINVMAAMAIFSMILLNANHMIHRNNIMQIEGELEQEVISIGQEIIEEAMSRSYDEVTVNAAAPPSLIPGGFSHSPALGPDTGENSRFEFDDFDDYHGWSDEATTSHGTFHRSVEVLYVQELINGSNITFEPVAVQSTFKKIEVTVTNAYLKENNDDPVAYKLQFIRNYYAD